MRIKMKGQILLREKSSIKIQRSWGSSMIINSEIEKIRDIIVATIPLEKLYLFGSYAYGTPNEDSDYDFYMVVPDGSVRPLEAIK